jgi:hypothetical protein
VPQSLFAHGDGTAPNFLRVNTEAGRTIELSGESLDFIEQRRMKRGSDSQPGCDFVHLLS